jgi:hypothetical protein
MSIEIRNTALDAALQLLKLNGEGGPDLLIEVAKEIEAYLKGVGEPKSRDVAEVDIDQNDLASLRRAAPAQADAA